MGYRGLPWVEWMCSCPWNVVDAVDARNSSIGRQIYLYVRSVDVRSWWEQGCDGVTSSFLGGLCGEAMRQAFEIPLCNKISASFLPINVFYDG